MKQYVLESSGGAGQENKMHHQYGLESRRAASMLCPSMVAFTMKISFVHFVIITTVTILCNNTSKNGYFKDPCTYL